MYIHKCYSVNIPANWISVSSSQIKYEPCHQSEILLVTQIKSNRIKRLFDWFMIRFDSIWCANKSYTVPYVDSCRSLALAVVCWRSCFIKKASAWWTSCPSRFLPLRWKQELASEIVQLSQLVSAYHLCTYTISTKSPATPTRLHWFLCTLFWTNIGHDWTVFAQIGAIRCRKQFSTKHYISKNRFRRVPTYMFFFGESCCLLWEWARSLGSQLTVQFAEAHCYRDNARRSLR
jgi:hypothetical protein